MQVRFCQRGVSLIEVLVAVLVFSIGLLGLAGLIAMSTRSTHVGYTRTQVTFLANSMAERMSSNPAAVWSGSYNKNNYPATAQSAGCAAAAPCNAEKVATHDQQIWSRQLNAFLPNSKATISCTGVASVAYNPSGNLVQRPPYGGNCAMSISWTERGAGDQAHRSGETQTFAWNFQP